MNRLLAIAWNTFREAIRDRVLFSLLFFGVIVLGASLVTEELTIGDQAKMIRGVAQGSVSLICSVIAMFLGVGLVWKELDRRTIYTIASKPIPRWMFVLGKYLGLLFTLAVNLAVMTGIYLVLTTLKLGWPHPSFWAFVGLLFVELALLCAWATLFSSYSSPMLATAFTVAVFLIGHLADDIWLFGQQAEALQLRRLSSVVYWLLPNFEVFNVQPQATHQLPVAGSYVLRAMGYGVAYTTVVLAGAMAVFQQRDFK